jgi:hypothetical protein
MAGCEAVASRVSHSHTPHPIQGSLCHRLTVNVRGVHVERRRAVGALVDVVDLRGAGRAPSVTFADRSAPRACPSRRIA